jgi:hypothetical protein
MRLASFFLASLFVACSSSDTTSEPPVDAAREVATDSAVVDSDSADTAIVDVADSTADVLADTPPDVVVPDTGTALSAECGAAGGTLCTEYRWRICPAGFEPVSSTDHYACGKAGGWCCRPAPTSPCAASGLGNCIPTCPLDCWQPVTDTTLTCDGTRKCCRDVCK